MIVASLQNPRVKQIRALASRKARDQTGLFFVEGLHLVLEAVQTSAPIELLVVAPELLRSPLAQDVVQRERDAGRPILAVSASVFRVLGARTFVQGMGNEGRGLAPEHLAQCDDVVSIPMSGRSDSLNLAVATSVILYEALAQRQR